jgi:hypothetical protein
MSKLIFLLLISSVSQAQFVEKTKAQAFLKKIGACEVAIGDMNGDQVLDPVFCVWNGVINKGTIREQSGCFLGRYSLNGDKHLMFQPYNASFMSSKQAKGSCTKDLVKKILTKFPVSDYLANGGSDSVMTWLQKNNDIQVIYDPANLLSHKPMKRIEEEVVNTIPESAMAPTDGYKELPSFSDQIGGDK